jgi:hypothetical protein
MVVVNGVRCGQGSPVETVIISLRSSETSITTTRPHGVAMQKTAVPIFTATTT